VHARKTPAQIATMRRAGRVVAEMHEECTRAARPGATTADVDAVARAVIERRGARSNFLGYHGFPAVICASPNEVVVHGIPGPRVLEEGDILSIDCGAIIDGWHADAAITVPVGEIDDESKRLITVTRDSLTAAIAAMTVGSTLGAIGAAVTGVVEAAGMSIVREYTGHGIGTAMHEEPAVPNYPTRAGDRMKLKEGLVLAIEPMVNLGRAGTRELDDGWTVVTLDGSRSAHFEHTIAITDHGPEVLTLPW
jgi:methionyl aminopeptidase